MKFELRTRFGVLAGVFVVLAACLFFLGVPNDPPGFSIDESSICYNAWTISQTGQDEYGQTWPLFFRAFGEYKSPSIIYLLAALFRLAGPSIAGARLLTAACGVLGASLLGLLAWKMTRRWIVAVAITATALLTPWLFESSRLVFEVALYPALLALFLLAVRGAHVKPRWGWSNVVALAITLALLTYSYSIGRLLAPLLALGLGLFGSRERWSGLIKTWISYALLCLPLVLFHRQNPDALAGRFKALTYLSSENSALANATEFARHYLVNINPWRWLVTGENNIRDHVEGMGSLLGASVALAIAGAAIVLHRHRRNPWWRFVLYALLISPVPASFTANPFPQLRLIAFPVFFLLLMVPAVGWLTKSDASRVKGLVLATAIVLIVAQGLWFQRLYHQKAPRLWYVFDARFRRKVMAPALNSEGRPIYLLDEPGKAGYIHALWYGVLAHLGPATFVRLPWGTQPPPASTVLSTEETCRECRLIARALNYIVYSVPPYLPEINVRKEPLTDFRAEIVCENPAASLSPGQNRSLSFIVKNISVAEWPCVGNLDYAHAVILQSRWLRPDGTVVAGTETEQHLPYDIEPGDTFGMTVTVTAPPAAGHYYLEVDLVQKEVARFSERASKPNKCAVEVVP
jgi:4-amino-4-deoxy-L-arabinose transferase-like glycosyltransferase